MIALILWFDCIRMNESTKRAPIDNQPRNEGSKLRRREQIHFEHGHRVRSNRPIEESVNPKLGDCSQSVSNKSIELSNSTPVDI